MTLKNIFCIVLAVGWVSSYCQDRNTHKRTFLFYRDKDGAINRPAYVMLNDEKKLVLGTYCWDTLVVKNDTFDLRIGKSKYPIYPGGEREMIFKVFYNPSIVYFFGSYSFVQVDSLFFSEMVRLSGRRRGVKMR